MSTITHHNFISLDYTGKLEDGTVFDTTVESVAKEAGIAQPNMKFGPAIICVGESQVLPGLDKALEGKEVGKDYSVEIAPEDAFGKRDVKKMKIIPFASFKEHNTRPEPGLQINVDGELGTVTRVSGGRVIVNFNHPLSGKKVIYEFSPKEIITDPAVQIKSFLNMALKIKEELIKISVQDEKALVELPAGFPQPFIDLISKKLAELVAVKELNIVSVQPKN